MVMNIKRLSLTLFSCCVVAAIWSTTAQSQTTVRLTVTVYLDGEIIDPLYDDDNYIPPGEIQNLTVNGLCFEGSDFLEADNTVTLNACPGDTLIFDILDPNLYRTSPYGNVSFQRWEVNNVLKSTNRFYEYNVSGPANLDAYLTQSITEISQEPVSARWAPDAARRSGGELLWGPAYQTAKSQVTDVNSEGIPSLLYSGEAFEKQVDFAVAGRGLDFVFSRVHRSGNPTGGGNYFGNGWTHNFDIVAQAIGDGPADPVNVSFGNGTIRTFLLKYYVDDEEEEILVRYYYSPGWDAELRLVFESRGGLWPAHYELEFGDGVEWIFPSFDCGPNSTMANQISSINDRYWVLNTDPEPVNKMTFSYDGEGRLQTISDTVGRTYTFAYKDGTDLIDMLTENGGLGRVIKYDYDNDNHLTSVTYPATTAHPTPDEPKIFYTYDGGRLSTVTDSRDNVALTNHYDLSTGVLISQDFGVGDDTSTVVYGYTGLSLEDGENHAIRVTDGTGNITEHYFNDKNQRVRFVRLVDSVPLTTYTTWLAYDFEGITVSDDLPKASILPDGTIISYTYAAEAPAGLNDSEFRYRMNLLGSERLASNGSGKKVIEVFGHNFTDFWDARFGESFQTCHSVRDEADNVLNATIFVYSDDGQGTLNGINYYGIDAYSAAGEQSFEDYELATEEILSLMNAPDSLYVADVLSNLAAGESIYEALSVPLLTASAGIYYESEPMLLTETTSKDSKVDKDEKSKKTKKLDKITTEASGDHHESFGYNVFGQVVEHLHPNNQDASDSGPVTRKDTFDYNASGYLITQIIDNTPSQEQITTTYAPDAVGHVTSITEPEGLVTTIAYDSLDQVTSVTTLLEAPAKQPQTSFSYDANGNLEEAKAYYFDENEVDQNVGGDEFVSTVYVYDSRNRITEIQREMGSDWNITRFAYDGNGNQIRVETPLAVEGTEPDNIVEYMYDARDLPVRIIKANTLVTLMDYDAAGRLVQQIEGYGTPEARTWQYVYDGLGHLESATAPNDLETQYERNVLGWVTQESVYGDEGLLAETVYDHDDLGRVITVNALHLDADGYSVNGDDRYANIVYTYTNAGNVSTKTIEANTEIENITTYTYDTAMRVASIMSVSGDEIVYEYDDNSNVIQITENAISTGVGNDGEFYTRCVHDELNRLIEVEADGKTSPGSKAKTLFAYDSLNRLVTETDALNRITKNEYDPLGRILSTVHDAGTGGIGAAIEYAYDANGRLTEQGDANNNITRYAYDAQDRLRVIIHPDGTTTQYTDYDVLGNLRTLVKPDGLVTHTDYDIMGRPVMQSYEHLAGRVDPGTTTWVYDSLGRIIETGNGVSTITHTYDTLGNLQSETSWLYGVNPRTIDYVYDNRSLQTDLNVQGSPPLKYNHDAVGRVRGIDQNTLNIAGFEYLGDRMLERQYGGNVTGATATYEPTGRRIRGIAYSVSGTPVNAKSYTWDEVYNLADDSGTPYTYDGLHRNEAFALDAAGNRGYTMNGVDAAMNRYTTVGADTWYYSPWGGLQSIAQTKTYTYDAQNRLKRYAEITLGSIALLDDLAETPTDWEIVAGTWLWNGSEGYLYRNPVTAGTDCILRTFPTTEPSLTVKYLSTHDPDDPDGNLTPEEFRTTDYLPKYYAQILLAVDTNTAPDDYPYLALRIEPDRLALIEYDGTTITELDTLDVECAQNIWYTVQADFSGNMVTCTSVADGAPQVTLNATSKVLENLGGTTGTVGFTVGENANYHFSALGYVDTAAVTDTYVEWDYDPYGRKIARTKFDGTNTEITRYVYDGWQLVQEFDVPTDTVIDEYVYGPGYIDDVIQSNHGGNVYYHHTDQQYSTVALTNTGGEVVEYYNYDAFGNPTFYDSAGVDIGASDINNPILYTGRTWQPELGLYDFRNRMYDPVVGRFTTPDPIGAHGDWNNLGNAYTYVGNNPGRYVDPLGLWPWDADFIQYGVRGLLGSHGSTGQVWKDFGVGALQGVAVGIDTPAMIPEWLGWGELPLKYLGAYEDTDPGIGAARVAAGVGWGAGVGIKGAPVLAPNLSAASLTSLSALYTAAWLDALSLGTGIPAGATGGKAVQKGGSLIAKKSGQVTQSGTAVAQKGITRNSIPLQANSLGAGGEVKQMMYSQKVANDIAMKGVHFNIGKIELAAKPDHLGGIIFKPVHPGIVSKNQAAFNSAVKTAREALQTVEFRNWLNKHAQKGFEYTSQQGSAKALEFKFLINALERMK